jgi:O-antigen/teichoic acid export membrane protein
MFWHILGIAVTVGLLGILLAAEFGRLRFIKPVKRRAARFLRAQKKRFLGSGLRRSSTLLILSQAINAAGAFIFWMVCARLFPAHEVGLATALISYGALVAAFTHLGLPVTVLRFLPGSKHRGGLFMAATLLVAACSSIGGALAVAWTHLLAPRLEFLQGSPKMQIILFILIIVTALGGLLEGVLTSLKQSQFVVGKAIATNAPRVILPFALAALGVAGIAGLYTAALVFGALYTLWVIVRKLLDGQPLRPRFAELRAHRKFAAANYLGSMFGILPATIVPLIVLSKLGPSQAAFFYMPMQLATFLGIIASSTCNALLAEVAHDDRPARYRTHVVAATRHLYQLLIPAALVLGAGGWIVLRIYGAQYAAHGYVPLLLLCTASLFVALNWLGDAWLNIQKRSAAYFTMNALNALAVVGAVYLFARHDLTGVAFGWLAGQVLSALVYVALFARPQIRGLRAKMRV